MVMPDGRQTCREIDDHPEVVLRDFCGANQCIRKVGRMEVQRGPAGFSL